MSNSYIRGTSASASTCSLDANSEVLSAARAARLKQHTGNKLFDSLDRYEAQECLAFSQCHWMLSTDEYKIPTEPPGGIISQLTPLQSNHCWFMIPEEADCEKLDFRDIHQIVRELTYGIYILNQLPSISLEANFDCSTNVQLPPAYIDTKVGQILTNIDYMMKALWHGAYIPKEKRQKFAERWRKKLDVNMDTGYAESKSSHIMDFYGAGLIDITKIKEYADIYATLPPERPDDKEEEEEKRFFMNRAEDLTMKITAFQRSIKQHDNLFLIDADWIVSSVVKLTDDKIDHIGYESLQAKLRLQKDIIKNNLANRQAIRQQLGLMKFISFMVPFLCAMRRKMKIPDISSLLPPLVGDAIKTERELPPLMLAEDFACKNFSYKNTMFSLHGGILIDTETPDPVPLTGLIVDQIDELVEKCSKLNDKALDPEALVQETYEIPTVTVDGKTYYMVKIEFDTYYSQVPRKPKWVQSKIEECERLKPEKLPIQEPQMMDVYKKLYGYRRALKFKNIPAGLKASAQKGLVAIFSELVRKSQMSQLMKQDESGLSLIHHAAMNNRPQIIAILILKSMDVNARRNQSVLSIGSRNYLLDGDEGSVPDTNFESDGEDDEVARRPATGPGLSDEYFRPQYVNEGPTALHLAARYGSLDAVACLCANYANILVMDHNGWAPIHHAAFYNHVPIIKLLVRKHDSLLELATQDDLKNTPMLLAASSGALEAVCCLIDLGCGINRTNEKGHNLIHLAALRFHTNVLEHFIHSEHSGLEVWKVVVQMLQEDDLVMQDAAVRCLEVLSISHKDHWVAIKEHGGIKALVKLLQSERVDIQSVAASVLCNISEEDEVRHALAEAGGIQILIGLLASPIDDIESRAAIILSDIAHVGTYQTDIVDMGAISPLIDLLDSDLENVLVNTVNAICVLSSNNRNNQTEIAQQGAIDPLVEFLSSVDSDILQAAAAAALAALCTAHKENQDLVLAAGAEMPLVRLVEARNMTVQVKASSAIEALCTDNPASQEAFITLDAPKFLIRLLKIWSLTVKEQGACALWAIAGHTKPQQRVIAEKIGTTQIIDALMLKSEKLQYVGCLAMTALCRENLEKQTQMCEEGGIEPLVRLVKSSKTSERVLVTAIKTLGILCIGVAHRNNKKTQHRIAEAGGIQILVGLLLAPPTQEIQVEVACSLACIALGNNENQEILKNTSSFKFSMLLNLLNIRSQSIRLQAGTALAIFGFNNTPQQYAMREAGGISYSVFSSYLTCDNEFYRAYAAFQIVILARVIVDRDQVSLTAEGVTQLVDLLNSEENNVVILSASLLSSLAHTRAGIPDAMVTSGAIDILVERLSSPFHLVRTSCAVALGYLSFNKTASRLLLSSCRNQPGLYDKLEENIGIDAKISDEFTKAFCRARKVGLPSQSLECNGGPPACPPKKEGSARPKTSMSHVRQKTATASRVKIRAVSAPAVKARARTAI